MTFADELENLNEENAPVYVCNYGDYGPVNCKMITVIANDSKVAEFYSKEDAEKYKRLIDSLPALLKVLRAAETCMMDASIIRVEPPMTGEDFEEKLNRISQVLGEAIAELERK